MMDARDKAAESVWHEHWWERLLPQWGALGEALGRFEAANLRSKYNIAWHAMHEPPVPRPPSLRDLTEEEIEARYVTGGGPLPDVAEAAYVMQLQRKRLASWVCDATVAALRLTDVSSRDPRRVVANRKRAIVELFADGNYSEPAALADRIGAALEKNPERARKYHLAAPTLDAQRKRRQVLIKLVKNMAMDAKADPEFGAKLWLSVEEFEEISRDFRDEGGETKRMRWSL